MIAVDVEAYDPDLKTRGPGANRDGYAVGFAVGTEAGFRKYYPIRHQGGDNLDERVVLPWLQDQLKLPVPKVGAHLLYDLEYLHKEGVKPVGPFYDVQVAEPLIDENRFTYQLGAIAKDYLGEDKKDGPLDEFLVRNFGKKNPKGSIYKAPGSVVAPYAEGDVDLPLRIFPLQRQKLEAAALWDLFELESRLVPMLLAMRQRGIRVDLDAAERTKDDLTRQIDEGTAWLRRETGVDVQIWAAASVAKVMDQIGYVYPVTPKTKKPSITAAWLEASTHPYCEKVVELRKLEKLRDTFVVGCILNGHTNGRVHCQFNQLKSEDGGTVTGRFSSSNPNLQFIPIRTDEGKLIRKMFLPDHGQRFWKKDYSQIEYRLLAHDAATLKLPGAAQVVQEYRSNPDADFHQIVAEMTGLERGPAKTVNFGLAYGQGVDKLCRQLGLEREEGEALLRDYHRRAPFMKPLSFHCMNVAAASGEIRTLLNRARRFDAWEWRNRKTGEVVVTHGKKIPGSRRAFTYKALNARIQGSAADVMKKAMVDIWESGVCDVLGVPQVTVHDELDGSYPDTEVGREALDHVTELMQSCVELLVPLKVDSSTGTSWGDVA
jgi:DNA polymerase I-like protein with 3'-5' exonuclease and polymerase domains